MNQAPLLPADDPTRRLTISDPEDPALPHLGMVGDTYTTLLRGEDTAGRYCLIDMHVPPGGGPPPHRHDFEEMFHVLAGEIEVTFRGEKQLLREGQTANVPANALHGFRNVSAHPARLLCMCTPAGQEEFFRLVGVPVESRTAIAPEPGEAEQQAQKRKVEELAPKFRTELP